MHPGYFGLVALEIAADRSREAERRRLVASARAARDGRPHPPAGPLRRTLARSAVALSRGAVGLARRLDEPTAAEVGDCLPRMTGSA